MNALLMVAAYFTRLKEKSDDFGEFQIRFTQGIPWIILPDALQKWIPMRQVTHFEESSEGDCAWVEYPMPETLKALDYPNRSNGASIHFHVKERDYLECMIPGKINFSEFSKRNYGHPFYRELKFHLELNEFFNSFCEGELFSTSKKLENRFWFYADKSFALINNDQLKKELEKFQWIGFLRLAQKVYTRTGILLDRKWVNDWLIPAIESAYPETTSSSRITCTKGKKEEGILEYAEKLIQMPTFISKKISQYDFSIGHSTLMSLSGDKLTEIYDELFSQLLEIGVI